MRAPGRAPRTGRANRVVLAVVGLLLFASGGAGVLAGLGFFGADRSSQAVLTPATDDLVAGRSWFWPVVVLAAGFVAIGAFGWLLLQVSTKRVHTLVIGPALDQGHTTLRMSAVGSAVERDVTALVGVSRATATFVGTPGRAWLRLIVTLNGRRSPGVIRGLITRQALVRLRSVLGEATPDADIEFVLSSPRRLG